MIKMDGGVAPEYGSIIRISQLDGHSMSKGCKNAENNGEFGH